MPIQNIDNDYQVYTVSDTLHQLVDKLNLMVSTIDDNIRQFDSSVGAIEDIIDAETGVFDMANDFVVNATNATFNDSADFTVNADNLYLNADGSLLTEANGVIVLDAHNNLANITLRSNGTTYGALRNNGGNLEVISKLNVMLTFDGSNNDTQFHGTITLPDGALDTSAKTVSGAINELHSEIGGVDASAQSAITALESRIISLENTVSSYGSRISSLESDVAYLQSLNIESKLNNHTTRLEDIETRLGLIGA